MSSAFGAWQKFKLAANNSVSLSTIGQALVAAGFSQAIDSASGYGQGADGYAKRFGADMARSASDNLFGTFLIASVLHEDPRFYVRRGLSFKQTLKYAGQRLVYTRSDSGDRVINFDGLLGPLASEGLANTYYPKTNRGVGSTFVRYSSDQGWKFCGNVLRQYWPRINRKLRILPEVPSSTAVERRNNERLSQSMASAESWCVASLRSTPHQVDHRRTGPLILFRRHTRPSGSTGYSLRKVDRKHGGRHRKEAQRFRY